MREEEVPRHLAGELCTRLSHALLDERVPDLPHFAARQGVVHGLAALHLSDEARVGNFFEHGAAKEDHQLITPQDPTGAVDGADTIGVAVERDAQISAEMLDGEDQGAEVLGLSRIGVVVREATVEVAVEWQDVEAQLGVKGHRGGTSSAVAGIDDDPGSPGPEAQLADGTGDVRLADALRGTRATRLSRGSREQLLRAVAQLRDRLAVERVRADHDLEAVVLGRVVAAGDHDRRGGAQVLLGEVRDGRRDDPDVDDVGEDADAVGERVEQAWGRQAAVAADDDGAAARALTDRKAERTYDIVGQIAIGDTTDVVFAEDAGVHVWDNRASMASTKRYYVFYYEHEHLWGDPKRRRVRVAKTGRPKEYMGPFVTKTEAIRALSKDASTYKTPRTDYRVKLLTPAGFARAWSS